MAEIPVLFGVSGLGADADVFCILYGIHIVVNVEVFPIIHRTLRRTVHYDIWFGEDRLLFQVNVQYFEHSPFLLARTIHVI